MTVLYTDGGCFGNQFADLSRRDMRGVVTSEHGTVLKEFQAPGGSNNIAELRAVLLALQWCVDHDVPEVEIRTDSMNNFAWAMGKKPGKAINDRSAVLGLQAEIGALPVVFKLVWVPRDENVAGCYLEQQTT